MRSDALLRAFVLVALVVICALYAAVRPGLAENVEHLTLIEFPIALLLVPILLWAGIRPPRRQQAREAPWRRHEQVVRALPDPAAEEARVALDAWLERGEAPERAARLVAPVGEEASFESKAREARSRRDRQRLLKDAITRRTGA